MFASVVDVAVAAHQAALAHLLLDEVEAGQSPHQVRHVVFFLVGVQVVQVEAHLVAWFDLGVTCGAFTKRPLVHIDLFVELLFQLSMVVETLAAQLVGRMVCLGHVAESSTTWKRWVKGWFLYFFISKGHVDPKTPCA